MLLLDPWTLEIATNQAALRAGALPIVTAGAPATAALAQGATSLDPMEHRVRATRRCPAFEAWFNFPRLAPGVASSPRSIHDAKLRARTSGRLALTGSATCFRTRKGWWPS
jgi:hypothetical protein